MKSKHRAGDTVWYMNGTSVKSDFVSEVRINESVMNTGAFTGYRHSTFTPRISDMSIHVHIKYSLLLEEGSYNESDLFGSKSDLINYISNQ